jgi:hypothetical protein
LSPENLEIMKNFKNFVKYNPQLIELDLSNCQLNNSAILFLAYCLRRSQSLRVLHLCGNIHRPRRKVTKSDVEAEEEDATNIVIDRLIERLHARVTRVNSLVIKPFN